MISVRNSAGTEDFSPDEMSSLRWIVIQLAVLNTESLLSKGIVMYQLEFKIH